MQQLKSFLPIVCLLLLGANLQAQTADSSFRIKLQNQYEAPQKDVSIINLRNGQTAKTDNQGMVTLMANRGDSVAIEGDHLNQAHLSLQSLTAENILVVQKKFSWKDLLTPMFYIINGGLWLLLFIIFAETGLFVGFFLPGDSLLFVAGIYNRELINSIFPFITNDYVQLLLMWLLIAAAGILGNFVGYWFGKRVGPAMYNWKDNFLFKQRYLTQAHDFYESKGGSAIIIARFVPIIRTFAPIVAGIVEMDRKKFRYFNIVGSLAWVLSMLVAGHFLQKWILSQFQFDLKSHLEAIVIGIVLVTTAPVIVKLFLGKKEKK